MYHYGHLIRILHSCNRQGVNNALAAVDMTSAQGSIVGYLVRRQTPPCARDVEEQFRLSHPTVSGLLSRMEKKEIISFRPDETDRRCKRIYLMPKGKEIADTIWQTIVDTEDRIVRDFTPEEKEQFYRFLLRAVANMGADPDFHFDDKEEKP